MDPCTPRKTMASLLCMQLQAEGRPVFPSSLGPLRVSLRFPRPLVHSILCCTIFTDDK